MVALDGETLLGPSQDLLLAVPGQAGPGVAGGGDGLRPGSNHRQEVGVQCWQLVTLDTHGSGSTGTVKGPGFLHSNHFVPLGFQYLAVAQLLAVVLIGNVGKDPRALTVPGTL